MIEDVTIFGFGVVGVLLDTVQGSVVNGVNTKQQTSEGILLQDTNHCVVENSTASENAPKTGKAIGIAIQNSGSTELSKNNVIVHNQANSNSLWGIAVFSSGNIIVNNTANNNNSGGGGNYGWGIYLGSSEIPELKPRPQLRPLSS